MGLAIKTGGYELEGAESKAYLVMRSCYVVITVIARRGHVTFISVLFTSSDYRFIK